MKGNPPACGAWDLLIQLLLSQRGQLPVLAAALELSPAQCHVLYAIEPGKPLPMKQLAASLSCDASNVTGLVDRLESRGLLRRVADSADRRVKVLELTPEGARLRSIMLERVTRPPESMDRMSSEEQKALVKILKRLLE